MITQEIIDGLRKRFSDVNFLIFKKSVEKARTPGELFDILSSIPEYPFMWDVERRRWVRIHDLPVSLKEFEYNINEEDQMYRGDSDFE